MYEQIFGKYPQVKVINYVLVNPERSYSKKEIAIGANISRVTLDSFINELEKLNILNKDGLTYTVNTNSNVVKILIKTQIALAESVMSEEIDKSEDIFGEALTDEEFEKFLDSFDYEVDMDAELNKIEHGEEISITKHNEISSNDSIIVSSKKLNTDIILTQYINQDYDKGSMNYG